MRKWRKKSFEERKLRFFPTAAESRVEDDRPRKYHHWGKISKRNERFFCMVKIPFHLSFFTQLSYDGTRRKKCPWDEDEDECVWICKHTDRDVESNGRLADSDEGKMRTNVAIENDISYNFISFKWDLWAFARIFFFSRLWNIFTSFFKSFFDISCSALVKNDFGHYHKISISHFFCHLILAFFVGVVWTEIFFSPSHCSLLPPRRDWEDSAETARIKEERKFTFFLSLGKYSKNFRDCTRCFVHALLSQTERRSQWESHENSTERRIFLFALFFAERSIFTRTNIRRCESWCCRRIFLRLSTRFSQLRAVMCWWEAMIVWLRRWWLHFGFYVEGSAKAMATDVQIFVFVRILELFRERWDLVAILWTDHQGVN